MIQLAQFDFENTQEHGELLLYDSIVTQTDRAKSIPYWKKIDEGTICFLVITIQSELV
jgi:hypothetical protein